MPRQLHRTGPDYYDVEQTAAMTSRSTDMIYRYIRKGIVQNTVHDPQTGLTLIPFDQLGVIMGQPRKGWTKQAITITLSDGRQITRIVSRPKTDQGTTSV